jgi:hypothetical protein
MDSFKARPCRRAAYRYYLQVIARSCKLGVRHRCALPVCFYFDLVVVRRLGVVAVKPGAAATSTGVPTQRTKLRASPQGGPKWPNLSILRTHLWGWDSLTHRTLLPSPTNRTPTISLYVPYTCKFSRELVCRLYILGSSCCIQHFSAKNAQENSDKNVVVRILESWCKQNIVLRLV